MYYIAASPEPQSTDTDESQCVFPSKLKHHTYEYGTGDENFSRKSTSRNGTYSRPLMFDVVLQYNPI